MQISQTLNWPLIIHEEQQMSRIAFHQIPKDMLAGLMRTEDTLSQLEWIDTRTLELVRYYISALNGCAYCLDMHYKEALHHGEQPERLHAIEHWASLPFYSEQEQGLLRWANVCVTKQAEDSEKQAAFRQLREHYDEAQIAWLTLVISQLAQWNLLVKAFGFSAGHYQPEHHQPEQQ
jgi:AhpD family alkylhydroperoxidase